MFEHLVISGGGPSMFGMIGIISKYIEKDKLDMKKIKSIYGCSSGALLAFCISTINLDMSIEDIISFIIERPWDNLGLKHIRSLEDIANSCSFFNNELIQKCIEPLLVACDMPITTTFKQWYEKTGIDLNFVTTQISCIPFKKCILSYKNFPDMSIVEGLQMSMALPVVFTPIWDTSKNTYIDGGLIDNFPIMECYKREQIKDKNKILGLKVFWNRDEVTVNEDITLQSFMATLMGLMVRHISEMSYEEPQDQCIVNCKLPDVGGPANWVDIFANTKMRKEFYTLGIQSAINHLDNVT